LGRTPEEGERKKSIGEQEKTVKPREKGLEKCGGELCEERKKEVGRFMRGRIGDQN